MTSEPAVVASVVPARERTEPTPATELRRTAVTAILFALLVTWMFTAWWSAPRASDVAELDRALSLGEVTGYHRSSGFDDGGGFWAGGVQLNSDQNGHLIVWQTTSGRTSYAEPDLARHRDTQPGLGEAHRGNPATNAVERRLQDAGVYYALDQGAAPALATGLILLGLFVLINGDAPRRGTRWFWFWIGGITAGLGVLAWLLLERVWPPASRPESRRMSGWQGVGLLILTSILASVAVGSLRQWLGSGLIPGY